MKILCLSVLGLLWSCDSEPTSTSQAGVSVAPVQASMVGYDLRRLRPPDGEALSVMFDRLRASSVSEGKRVAVLFSADWCEPCRKIDAELGNLHPSDAIGDVRIFELKEEDWKAAMRMDEFNNLRRRWYAPVGSYPVMILLNRAGDAEEEMKVATERLEAEGLEPTLPMWFSSTRVQGS